MARNGEQNSENYPLGVQDFPQLRDDGYTYVDKTAYIYELLRNKGKYYFLSRPRRFGKSLFLSTLEAFFEGRRELFRGLAIDQMVDDWTPSPVVHIDINSQEYITPDDLRQLLISQVRRHERKFGVTSDETSPALRFADLLENVHEKTGRRVVVLIDEYDKPLVNSLDDEPLCDTYRKILKGFYGNLKSGDRHIRFAMMTGITRFSKVSIFSDLNNLDDISLDDKYAAICGITEDELLANFPRGIASLGEANSLTWQQTVEELRGHYDGYHFSRNAPGVYNPYCLLKAFDKREFGAWWSSTGMTTMLANRVKRDRWSLPELERAFSSPQKLADIEAYRDPVPLLFQTGYLTIKGYDPEMRDYILGYPNREVRQGFEESLFRAYVDEGMDTNFDLRRFTLDLRDGDTAAFMRRLQAMFAGFPYEDHGNEYWFRSVVYVIFVMVGQIVRVEDHTARGRSDLTVFSRDKIYVFEFKYGDGHTPGEAVAQIRDRGYADPHRADPREKILIGAVYRPKDRELRWLAEPLENKEA